MIRVHLLQVARCEKGFNVSPCFCLFSVKTDFSKGRLGVSQGSFELKLITVVYQADSCVVDVDDCIVVSNHSQFVVRITIHLH